jgi:tRNA pseudouridine55 synthase
MATGVLVVLAGEATKLGPYLTADDKGYLATVRFGRATDTLDAEGETNRTGDVPPWLSEALRAVEQDPSGAAVDPRLEEALAAEIARTLQVPPAYSAIHVGGRRSHDLARAGEAVALDPRPVAVRRIRVTGAGAAGAEPWIALELDVGKGYYVRSLARDLGERLGVPAHLSALRRTRSGSFRVDEARGLDADAAVLLAALIPMAAAAARALATGRLTAEGVARARQGKRLVEGDFDVPPPVGEDAAWLDPAGRLVAIGARAAGDEGFVIHRGFVEK